MNEHWCFRSIQSNFMSKISVGSAVKTENSSCTADALTYETKLGLHQHTLVRIHTLQVSVLFGENQ